MKDSGHKTQSVASVLKNTSDAMNNLHVTFQDVEPLMLGAAMGTNLNSAKSISLQDVDLISQSIVEIATLLNRISAQLPQTMMIDVRHVVEPIRLERLRHVIAEGTEVNSLDNGPKPASEISLF